MKIVKNLFLGVLLSMGIAMPALASESQSGFPDNLAYASLVFESNDAKPMQLAMLSLEEMKETKGGVWYHTTTHSHLYAGPFKHGHYHWFHHSNRQWYH